MEFITEASKEGQRRIGEQFVADYILRREFVRNIPKPETFSADLEQLFFEKLRETFVYETIEDIQHELEQYEQERTSIKKEMLLLDEEKQQLQQSKASGNKKERLDFIKKRRKDLDLKVSRLKKPTPHQDKRFVGCRFACLRKGKLGFLVGLMIVCLVRMNHCPIAPLMLL